MATQIIADGTGALNSSDVVVTSAIAVSMKDFVSTSKVYVYLKDDAAAYQLIGTITSDNPGITISAPGTYRFTRPASSGTCGVFSG